MRTAVLIFLSALSVSALSAEVYRSVDSEGNVIYSDRPPAGGVPTERVTVENRAPSNPVPIARVRTPASDDSAAEPAEADIDVVQTPETRAENCALARERNARYETARRLYRESPDGERAYLDDEQIDAAKARAQAEVDEWCN